MTEWQIYEKYCRSGMTMRQAAAEYGVEVEHMRDIIAHIAAHESDYRREMRMSLLDKPRALEHVKKAYETAGVKCVRGLPSTPKEKALAVRLVLEDGIRPYWVAEASGRDGATVVIWVRERMRRNAENRKYYDSRMGTGSPRYAESAQ